MPLWYLDKKTNAAGIFGGVSSLIRNKAVPVEYRSRLTDTFSRKKDIVFEDENYRIEKHHLITTGSKKSK